MPFNFESLCDLFVLRGEKWVLAAVKQAGDRPNPVK